MSNKLQKSIKILSILFLITTISLLVIKIDNLTSSLPETLPLFISTIVISVIFFVNKRLVLLLFPSSIIVGPVFTQSILGRDYDVTFSEFILPILLILLLIHIIIEKKTKQHEATISLVHPIILSFLFFLAFYMFSLLWTPDIVQGIIELKNLSLHFITLIIISSLIKNKKDRNYALLGIALAGFSISLQLFWKVYGLGGFSNYGIQRTAIITNIGRWVYVAANIVLTLPILLALTIYTTGFWPRKFWGYLSFLFNFLVSLFTLGKAEVISLGISVFYFFLSLKKSYLFLLFVIATTIFLLTFLPQTTLNSLVTRFQTIESDPATVFRLTEVKTAFWIFLSNPLIGGGVGSLKIRYFLFGLLYDFDCNNFLLQIAAETGLIGFFLTFVLIISITATILNLKRKLTENSKEQVFLAGIKASLLLALINGLIEVTFFGLYYGILFWSIVGILIGFEKITLQEKQPYKKQRTD